MGACVDLRIGNYSTIKNKLITEFGMKDEVFLEKILLSFGEKVGENYILLNNEVWDEYNSYYEVSVFIDKYYGVSDSNSIFSCNMSDGIANMNAYEVADELEVELSEHPDYD